MISECQQYANSLSALHKQFVRYLDQLDAAALDWAPTAGANSLAVLAAHTAGSERFLIGQLVGGVDAHRDRDAEFGLHNVEAGHLKQLLAQAESVSLGVLSRLTEADMAVLRPHREGPRTTRWCIVHVIEHIAEHLGHAGLTRQLWDARP